MSILKAIETSFITKKEKGWEKMYYFFDIHSTIVKPNYKSGVIPTEFYPYAKETLQYLSTLDEVCMILYTCSHPHEIELYKEFFKNNHINFTFVNENPEILTDPIGYGCYDVKPYINVLFDDKAGFDAEKDWLPVLRLMKQKYNFKLGVTPEKYPEGNEISIQVSGLSNSGKTTLGLMITDFLREKGFSVDYVEELDSESLARVSQNEREEIILDKIKKVSVIETKIHQKITYE